MSTAVMLHPEIEDVISWVEQPALDVQILKTLFATVVVVALL